MTDWLAALPAALVGAVLLWAGGFKLGARGAAAARRSALTRLVGAGRAVPVYRALGVTELAVGALLVLPPAATWEAAVAVAVCLGFLGFLAYSRVVAPESSCGCLSDRHTPVRWRAFARAGLLAVLSAGPLAAGGAWWLDAAGTRPVASALVLVALAALVVALSEDLDAYWLLPLRRLRLRISHPLGRTAGLFEVPVESSVHQLLRSPAYQQAGAAVRSDLLDSWDEGEWRMLSYGARHGDRAATAVFAVPRTRYEPDAVRAALVDEEDGAVLWQYERAAATVS
ncbi:MAG TPA: MauE/DoxX family redox-associated membrane protein [Pseudonocardiaceae bacterium]